MYVTPVMAEYRYAWQALDIMGQVKVPFVVTIHSQGNKLVTGVKIIAIDE